MSQKKFLFVLTSHGELGNSGEKTGFHFSEMSDPYYILEDHSVTVELASIQGGEPPADPESIDEKNLKKNEASVNRFREDEGAMKKLRNTIKISEVDPGDYEGIYLPGGHGTMWDFPENKDLQHVIEELWKQEKIVAAVCHGPAGLLAARNEDGESLVKDRRLNCFTNEEEKKVGKDKIVPFLLETKLREQGAIFEHTDPFLGIVIEDSRLITGQNPPSAQMVAKSILQTMGISPYVSRDKSAKVA